MARSKTGASTGGAVAAKPKVTRARQAAPEPGAAFTGFPADALAFLRELDEHNEREWFETQRARYERSVRGPALAFIAAMAPELARISKRFVADPRPQGGSLMRIHRDVRFGADKRPYKTNIGIHFRHTAGKDVHAPGIYVHVAPDGCFLGVGLWHPEPEPLAQIRKRIVEKSKAWQTVRDDPGFRKVFEPGGESLARAPRGFDAEHVHVDDLRRKSHISLAKLGVRELGRADLPAVLGVRIAAAKRYLGFLCAAIGQPF
ncbi:MAG: TIGR02453 family protein [Deltaproteobacteria bacterium]|nr:TIGR02453 family protein [Nannocystaceae bacterium]